MAAVRNSTAEVIRARPRHRLRPKRAPVFRPIKPVPPDQKPPRNGRWLLIRLLLAVALSFLVHWLCVLIAPHVRRPDSSKSVGTIEFVMKQKGATKEKTAPNVSPRPQTHAPPKPVKPTAPAPPKPIEDDHPPPISPDSAFVPKPTPTPQTQQNPATSSGGAQSAPPSKPGHVTRPDGSPVQLFDPNGLRPTVDRFQNGLPSKDQFMAPSAGDGNDPAATKARITGRLQGQIDQANADGRVAGGLVSSCNDGFDNDVDGKIDCADLGCRLLPVCQNTVEFKYQQVKEIPDDDTRGLTTKIVVDDDDEDALRALSVSIDLVHGAPGDLAIEINHDGQTQVVLKADPATHFFPKAFYLGDFIGKKAQGTWTVTIRDVIHGTSGRIRGWILYVTR